VTRQPSNNNVPRRTGRLRRSLFVDRFGQVVYVGDHASAWALRDIKAKRTKLAPAGQSDLETLIEMGRFVEMQDDALMLTNMDRQAFDQ
jgi:hypothetical protein